MSAKPANPFLNFGPAQAWANAMSAKPDVMMSWGVAAQAARSATSRPDATTILGTREVRSMGALADSINPLLSVIQERTYGSNAPADYMVADDGKAHLALAVSRSVAIAAQQTSRVVADVGGMRI